MYPKADWAPRVFRAKSTFQALARTSVDAYFHSVSILRDDMRRQLFSDAFKARLGGYSAAEVFRRHARRAGTDDPLALVQYLDLKTYLVGDINTKVDRASMAHSLEVREPLMDHPLVEWLASLPSSLKVRGQEGKYLLKKAMEPYLPQRDPVPAEDGILGAARAAGSAVRCRQRVNDAILGPRLAATGVFNPRYLKHLVDSHLVGRARLQRAALDAAHVRGVSAQRDAHATGQRCSCERQREGRAAMSLRILHVLDHSIPLHSGYTFRTRAILREQRRMGWETFHLTSPKHSAPSGPEEDVDGLHFYRTLWRPGALGRIPGLRELALMRATARRLEEVARIVRPDILHAHSPVLNALPALWVGRRLGMPVVYEVRAFWEDAAADHGTSREWGLRYRLTRALETYALRRADAVTTICEGLRSEIVARGIAADKVTVIPNAVDIEKFTLGRRARRGAEGGAWARRRDRARLHRLVLRLRRVWRCCWKRCRGYWPADPRVRVLLVGGGPQEANSKKLRRDARPRRQGRVRRPRAAQRGAALLRPRRCAASIRGCRCGSPNW